MPQYQGVADPYAEWSTDSPEDTSSKYYGGIGLIGGILPGVIWDDPSIRPPDPKYVLPPEGTPVDPPRVKRPRVPPPSY